MLESYIKNKRREKEILLMTHIVLGYPSFDDCFQIVREMVDAGVDLMELQIPFSEPIADGPVILNANQKALANGVTVQQCIDFSKQVVRSFDIPFLFMTYYNILFQYGVKDFSSMMSDAGMYGAIVPDLPPEEGEEYLQAMKSCHLSPIFIFTPTTTDERMKKIASCGEGFIYCVARKGVTGSQTDFTSEFHGYLERCRKATTLPLALGFGVKDKEDIDFLTGKADIAVIGSQTIRLVDQKGVGVVGEFIRGLRSQSKEQKNE
ncbi:MAG: tryptophan synthase subunit alpha [Pseudomonadota bacterium]